VISNRVSVQGDVETGIQATGERRAEIRFTEDVAALCFLGPPGRIRHFLEGTIDFIEGIYEPHPGPTHPLDMIR
jgi:hypothetical protein